MATNALCEVAVDFEEYARQTTLLKNILDWQASMVGAKREGRAEGREEGRAEGRTEGRTEGILEIARKMKEMGFLTEQIQAVTGLSAESIEHM